MDTLLDVLYGITSLLIPIAIFVLVVRRALRREREWPQTAAVLGLTYTRHDPAALEPFSSFTALFTPGSHSLANVLSGNRAWIDVWLADYRFRTQPGGTVEPYGFTVCLLEDSRLDLPHVLIRSRRRPRSMTRAPLVLRPDDDPEVILEGEPELTRAFSVRTRSPDAVRRLLVSEVREKLNELATPFVEVEARGTRLVVDQRRWVQPAEAGAFIDRAVALAEAIRSAATPW